MEEQLTFPDGLKPVLPNVFLSRVTRFIADNDLEFHLFDDILIIAKYNNRQNTFKFLWIKTHEELHDGNIE